MSNIKEKSIVLAPPIHFPRLDPRHPLAYFPVMAVRSILTAPDPRLKAVSRDVDKVDAEIRRLIDDMFESMYEAKGIGLAAVQIGVPRRVIVMDLAQKDGGNEPLVFINPKIVWASQDTAIFEEGCLSVPEIWDEVERPARIKAEHLDRDGRLMTLDADGLFSTCLQHEMDHLEGVLFLDHLSRLKRAIALRKLAKAKRLNAVG
jgi:peptide deformylase